MPGIKGLQARISKYIFQFMNNVLILANSEDPRQYAAFHLDLHCMPKNSFNGFPVYKWGQYV